MEKQGYPAQRKVDLTRKSGGISDSDIEMLFKKSDRCERTNLVDWLPAYFDDVPIGAATYTIKWKLYNLLDKYKNAAHPMHEAWKELSPKAIEIIEFVMDIRKGEWTDEEIEKRMNDISNTMAEIRKAQEDGNWFAKSVTCGSIMDICNFVNAFPTLQEYIDVITGKAKWVNPFEKYYE